jgi:hypothetical protein
MVPAKRDRKAYMLYAVTGNPLKNAEQGKERAIYGWALISFLNTPGA